MKISAIAFAALIATIAGGFAQSEPPAPTDAQLKFFETKIRPVLAEHCYGCHSKDEKVRAGLRVDNRDSLLHGGDSGPAIVPGSLEKSLLWTAITWAERDYEMPPKQKLSPEVIADFREWIEMGAPDPRVPDKEIVKSEIDIEAGKQFWSFQKPVAKKAPVVSNAPKQSSAIDRFVLAKLKENGLQPAAQAQPDELLRRLYFDLIGLPPSPQEIDDYAKAWKMDPEAAHRAQVDTLLASPRFGERWGRHWLDVARYAESTGKEVNVPFPHAWRYRDYVIDAFNADKPYDQFIREQIAGDLLKIKDDADWQENLIATGFLAIGTKGLNERNPRQFAYDVADEQIDATSQAFLGLTVSCARCHDHKSDPIPTADYYSLAGIFLNSKTYFGTVNVAINRRGTKLLELPVADSGVAPLSSSARADLEQRISETQARQRELQQEARRQRAAGESVTAQQQLQRIRSQLAHMSAQLNAYNDDGSAKTVAMGMQEREQIIEPVVLVRGEIDRPAQTVESGFPQVLKHGATPAIKSGSSGRLELAEWIASEENPLTARVMVNRVWAQLFGRGLVDSLNNFGATGQAPSHPQLLDHLAVGFMEDGWSVKNLIRDVVTSASYRRASAHDAQAFDADPENRLLWRMSPRRLDAEALRDAMLVASGELDLERPGPPPITRASNLPGGIRRALGGAPPENFNRSVFMTADRDGLPAALALFDGADPSRVIGRRDETNVPGQALYLMNNSFVIDRAENFAARLTKDYDNTEARLKGAFQICYGRPANDAEVKAALDFVRNFEVTAGADSQNRTEVRRNAFIALCQALFASAEFRYLD